MKRALSTRQFLSRLLKLHSTLVKAVAAERKRAHTSGCTCDFCRAGTLCGRGFARLRRQLPPSGPAPRDGDELPLFARLDARTAVALGLEAGRLGQPLSAVASRALDAWVASPRLRAALRVPAQGERGSRTAGKVFLRVHGEASRMLRADGRKPNTLFYAVLAQWADAQPQVPA